MFDSIQKLFAPAPVKSTASKSVNISNGFTGVWQVLALLAVLWVAVPCQADMMSNSWIVRSEVEANQSMLCTGHAGSVNASDNYYFESWPFRGGFEWQVTLDPGTLTGNVEGALQATYDNYLSAPGLTTVQLGYSGIKDESRVDGSVKANVSIRPYIGVNVLGLWTDASLPISVVNVDLGTHADFTTGLGTAKATDSQQHTVVNLGGDVLLISYGIDIYAKTSTEFKPKLFNGILKYEHVESGTKRSVIVDFWNDGVLDFNLNLDQPGRWIVTLEDFYLEQSDFRTEFGLGVGFQVGAPIIGTSASINADISVLDTGYFTPNFDIHFLNDNIVGQFCINVVPEPSSLALLGIGLMVTIRRRG